MPLSDPLRSGHAHGGALGSGPAYLGETGEFSIHLVTKNVDRHGAVLGSWGNERGLNHVAYGRPRNEAELAPLLKPEIIRQRRLPFGFESRLYSSGFQRAHP